MGLQGKLPKIMKIVIVFINNEFNKSFVFMSFDNVGVLQIEGFS